MAAPAQRAAMLLLLLSLVAQLHAATSGLAAPLLFTQARRRAADLTHPDQGRRRV